MIKNTLDETIVMLQTTEISLRKDFHELSDNLFDNLIKKYPNRILDIYEVKLESDAEEIALFNSVYFKLNNEIKYLNLIENIFEENDNTCYIETTIFKNYSEELLLRYINELDLIDKYLLLKQIDIFKRKLYTKFCIDNINILKMFLKLMLREIIPLELYFKKKPIIIFSNYDLSLPILFKKNEDISFYEKLVRKHQLYLR